MPHMYRILACNVRPTARPAPTYPSPYFDAVVRADGLRQEAPPAVAN